MSQFLSGIVAVGILGIIVVFISSLNWPDITDYLSNIQTAVNYLYFFNTYIPINTLFTISGIVILYEFLIFSYKLLTAIASWISGRSWGHQNKSNSDD